MTFCVKRMAPNGRVVQSTRPFFVDDSKCSGQFSKRKSCSTQCSQALPGGILSIGKQMRLFPGCIWLSDLSVVAIW
jgi:hypothetical protein